MDAEKKFNKTWDFINKYRSGYEIPDGIVLDSTYEFIKSKNLLDEYTAHLLNENSFDQYIQDSNGYDCVGDKLFANITRHIEFKKIFDPIYDKISFFIVELLKKRNLYLDIYKHQIEYIRDNIRIKSHNEMMLLLYDDYEAMDLRIVDCVHFAFKYTNDELLYSFEYVEFDYMKFLQENDPSLKKSFKAIMAANHTCCLDIYNFDSKYLATELLKSLFADAINTVLTDNYNTIINEITKIVGTKIE